MRKITIMKESRQLLFIFFLMVISFCYAMFQGGFVSWFLFYTLMPFLVYALLLKFVPIQVVKVERAITPSKLVRGKSGQVEATLQIKTWLPLIYLTIQELGNGNVLTEKKVFFVGTKKQFNWTYQLENLPRGMYSFEGFHLQFHDFFGWMTRNISVKYQQTITVYPNILPIDYKPIQMQVLQGGESYKFSITKDMTLVTGIRNYQSGDQFSRIHWKSFAKDETLRTKEFEDRKSQKMVLVIDRSVEYLFDAMVDFTASIIKVVLKNRGDISLLSVGSSRYYEPNIKTDVQFEKVLNHLALVQPDGQFRLDALLVKEESLLKGSFLIIITSYLNEQLENYFSKHRGNLSIICFVVVDENQYELMKKSIREYPQVKMVPITEKLFNQAFTEVTKP